MARPNANRGLAAILAAAVAACGPTATTEPLKPKQPPPEVTQTKPSEFAEQAKRPASALILGTDGNGGSTMIPLAGDESSATVDAMWVDLGVEGSPSVGGSTPVILTTRPQTDGAVRVGMYEQFAGGMGPQWRSAVWIGAFIASSTLDKDLTDFRFTAESTGYIDGASAGGLMTAGFLASLTGTKIDPETTMTGTINPDGTIGPVGGIPQKFLASIQKGKKRLGFPVGLQYAQDLNTGEMVDLVELAAANGAEAFEIADIYEAYTLLTGQQLPEPVPVDASEMKLEAEVDAQLQIAYQDWRTLLEEEWQRLLELDGAGRLPVGLRTFADLADAEAQAAERLLQAGKTPSAYLRIISAVVFAATATATSDVLELVQLGDLARAKEQLSEFEGLATQTEQALRTVGDMRPDTMGEHLTMLSAFQQAVAGWGFHTFGSEQMVAARGFIDSLEGYPVQVLVTWDMAEQIVAQVSPSILAIARAVAQTRMSLETLEIEGVKGLDYTCSMPIAKRLSASYASAAAANINYFETLFVKDLSNMLNMPYDSARSVLMSREPDYLVSYMASSMASSSDGLPAVLKADWGEASTPWTMGTLAGSILSYFKTSLLISKWYSLNVSNDPYTGLPQSVQYEKAFTRMTENAERHAREHAHAAKLATGSIPIQARVHYQNAVTLRSGELSDQLKALEYFWSSSVYSQTAVMLARNESR